MSSNTEAYSPHITPSQDRLLGKVALITGGGNGIGQAIALRFAQEGAKIVIADIDSVSSDRTAEEIRSYGRECLCIPTDISSRPEVEELVSRALEHYSAIDILVNNAGVVIFGSLIECRLEDWSRMLSIDLTGALHCTQLVARHMIERNRGGRMIHIGSTASLYPTSQQGAYSVAKAGLGMLSATVAMELAPYRITSNLLCPEGAVTDINRELLRDPTTMAELESKIPLGRLSTTAEIAAAAAYLASDEAAYMTGTEMVHDGGVTKSSLWWR